MRSVVVMMTKAPVPFEVKTRLCPELSPEQAAELSKLFIQDMVDELGGLAQGLASFALAYTPREAEAHFTAMLPASVPMFSQPEGGLGERMAGIFERIFQEDYERVVVVGSDLPDLPRRIIANAIQALEQPERDLVLGPTPDGGYYLIGLKRPVPEIFHDIPWSTGEVLERTLEKARGVGLSFSLVERWDDIDTYGDLVRFVKRHEDTRTQDRGPGWRSLEWGRRLLAGGLA